MHDVYSTAALTSHLDHTYTTQIGARGVRLVSGMQRDVSSFLNACFGVCRYLAVRCGLASAVERDVTASKERTPLDRLQPASLVPHYKFSAKASHVTDAAGDHVPLVEHLSTPFPYSNVIISSYLSSNHCRDMCNE